MRVTVVAVGRLKGPLAPAVRDFEKRASHYWKLEVVELPEGSGSVEAEIMSDEGRRILDRVPEDTLLWALTRNGKGISSRGLARYLESLAVAASPGISFALGGAWGLDPGVLARCDRKLSLSAMTLPHDLARLVLLEQLYRAGTIRRNEPYHKGSRR